MKDNQPKMIPLIGLGAGGHAGVVIEILRLTGTYEPTGLLDSNPESWGAEVLGVPVLGDDDLLPFLRQQGVRHAFIGVGGTQDNAPRRRLYEHALTQGFQVVGVTHPSAVISPSAQLGDGFTIMAGVIVNAQVILGNNVIVNTGATVEHDCVIGDHVHIATGVKLGGKVRVGAGAHIGLGASIRQEISIGEGAIVGAGAAVVKDVDAWSVVVGVPARLLKNREGARPDSSGIDQPNTSSGSTSRRAAS